MPTISLNTVEGDWVCLAHTIKNFLKFWIVLEIEEKTVYELSISET